ncbi:hypothetical protein VP1G_00108 [Cytospora mali]|uniref:DUF6923 domain-containing protein n=1 Tax=Cytospora mali TaxID=578113 RepID=A0A194UMD4_CYTMA|nr:hypothetical protein VP1G_00108 [Valsa mali var. pyri (nom. inval.)]
MASTLRPWLVLGLLALSPTRAESFGSHEGLAAIDAHNLAPIDKRDLYGGSSSVCYTYTTEFLNAPSAGPGWFGGGPGWGGPGIGWPGSGGPGHGGGPGGGGWPGSGGPGAGGPGGPGGPGGATPSLSGPAPTSSGSAPPTETVVAVAPGLPFTVSLASYFAGPNDQVVSFTEDPPVDWLYYDPVTRSFYGTVPTGQAPGVIIIHVRTVNPTTGQIYQFDIVFNVIGSGVTSSTTTPPGSSVPSGNPTSTSSIPASSVSTGPAQTIQVGAPFLIDLTLYLQNSADTVTAIATNPDTAFLDNGFDAVAKDIVGTVPPGTSAPQTITVTISAISSGRVSRLQARAAGDSYVAQFEVFIYGPATTTSSSGSVTPPVSSPPSGIIPPSGSSTPGGVTPSGSSTSGGSISPNSTAPGGVLPSGSAYPGSVVPPSSSTPGGGIPSSTSIPGGVPPPSSTPGSVVPPSSSTPGNGVPPSSSTPGGVLPPSSSTPGVVNPSSGSSAPSTSPSSTSSTCTLPISILQQSDRLFSITSLHLDRLFIAARLHFDKLFSSTFRHLDGLFSSNYLPYDKFYGAQFPYHNKLPGVFLQQLNPRRSTSSTSGIASFPSPRNVSSLAPLSCSGPGYETQNKILYAVNIATGAYVLVSSAISADTTNALAYHPQENYLYAVSQNNHDYGYILRIGAGGTHENTTFTIPQTNPTGTSATSMTLGDIDVNLQFWLGYTNGNGWVQVDLNSANTATYGQVVASGTADRGNYLVSDWAYLPAYPNKLWALGQQVVTSGSVYNTWLMYFDLTTHTWVNSYQFQGINGGTYLGVSGMAQWGAVYTATDGYLYGLENNSGQLWKFKVNNPTQADAVFVSQGPPGGINDGARCMLNTNLNVTLS